MDTMLGPLKNSLSRELRPSQNRHPARGVVGGLALFPGFLLGGVCSASKALEAFTIEFRKSTGMDRPLESDKPGFQA